MYASGGDERQRAVRMLSKGYGEFDEIELESKDE